MTKPNVLSNTKPSIPFPESSLTGSFWKPTGIDSLCHMKHHAPFPDNSNCLKFFVYQVDFFLPVIAMHWFYEKMKSLLLCTRPNTFWNMFSVLHYSLMSLFPDHSLSQSLTFGAFFSLITKRSLNLACTILYSPPPTVLSPPPTVTFPSWLLLEWKPCHNKINP